MCSLASRTKRKHRSLRRGPPSSLTRFGKRARSTCREVTVGANICHQHTSYSHHLVDTQDVEKSADVGDHIGAIGQGYREELYNKLFEDNKNVSFWLTCDKGLMNPSEIARHRWHEAMRQIALRIREQQAPPAYDTHRAHSQHDGVPDVRAMLPNLRASHIVPKLRQMAITQELHSNDRHEALVRFLRFSPDGNFLVTSR